MKAFIKGFRTGMKDFGETIAVIINCVLLSLVYFIGVGATALSAKIIGKSFLDLKKRKSYWSDLNLGKKKIEEYYRQF